MQQAAKHIKAYVAFGPYGGAVQLFDDLLKRLDAAEEGRIKIEIQTGDEGLRASRENGSAIIRDPEILEEIRPSFPT